MPYGYDYKKDSSDPSKIKNWDAPPGEGWGTLTEEEKRKAEEEQFEYDSDGHPGAPEAHW